MSDVPAYVVFEDWTSPGRTLAAPNPDDPMEVEWTLRYGTPSRGQALVAASYIAAYKQLVGDSPRSRDKKVAAIRAQVRDATKETADD